MSKALRIAKNSTYIFIGEIISHILQLIIIVYLARSLGDINFGLYSFAVAFAVIFMVISDLGLSNLITREISRDISNAHKTILDIIGVKIIFSIAAIIVIIILVNFLNYPIETKILICIVGLTTVVSSYINLFRSIFRAFERMDYEFISKIIERSTVFILSIPILYLYKDLTLVLLAMLLAETVSLIITKMFLLNRLINTKLILSYISFNFPMIKNIVKESLPFGLASIFGVIYFQTDTLMLSALMGDAAVGWYNAASKLVMATLFIPSSFIGALYPVMSNYFVTSKKKLIIIYEKSFQILMVIGIAMGIMITMMAENIIVLLYGNEFKNSIIIMQILIWVASILFLINIVGYTLASINKQIVDTKITGISALLNVFLNFVLISRYGYIGACIASIVSQLLVFLFDFNYLQTNGYYISISNNIFKPIIAGFIALCSMILFKVIFMNNISIINTIVILIIGSIIYLQVLNQLGIIDYIKLINFMRSMKIR